MRENAKISHTKRFLRFVCDTVILCNLLKTCYIPYHYVQPLLLER